MASKQKKRPKLVLLDGMALVYRAHFAMIRSPRYTSKGLCTSAIFGVLNTLLDVLRREEPTHIAVAFDTAEPTARHEEFADYKAQREEMPEDIAAQLPGLDRLFEAFNIPIIRAPGYEADDIIGTLARRAAQAGFDVVMVTPDKDYDQLVSEHITLFRPGRQGSEPEILGVQEVLNKWGIERVEQVVDILGLMGDSSDNIPGIPGVGEKTAKKLIAQFGSIENLIANADSLKGKLRERVKEHADQALLSKRLVTIQTDVPIEIDLESLRRKEYDAEKLRALLAELEFETIGKRLFGDSFTINTSRAQVVREKREKEIQASLFDDQPDAPQTLRTKSHVYETIDSIDALQRLVAHFSQVREISWDTETTGLDPHTAEPLGIAVAWEPGRAYYITLPSQPAERSEFLDVFRQALNASPAVQIGHNLKYDLSILKWQGHEVSGSFFDTMIAHTVKEPDIKHGLDYLAKLYLNYEPVSITQLIGKRGNDQKNMRDVPLEQLAEYACEDADITLQIAAALRPEIERAGLQRVCYEVEFPLIPVLVDMEYEGIRLDVEALRRYSQQLEEEIDALRRRIFEAVGHEFNIDSPKQLGVVLYEELRIDDNPKRTATGQYSTRESELQRLSHRHPIVQDILEYRNAVKLKSVYVDQLPNYVHPRTGRIHTHYSQTWTATGRMQSTDPNLQTIPIRKERGREIRAAFVARDENYYILSADYSQIELRVVAHMSGDEAMIEAFRQDLDIHAATAARIYGVPLDQVTREMRDQAKTVNFGIIYGMSAYGLQQRLNISRAEARELIEQYFQTYPGVKKFIDATIAAARKHGYVETLTGRRRYLRDINSRNRTVAAAAERLAVNTPLQGTAADILKLAMIRVHKALRDQALQTKMLLTVHDEIIFDLHRDEVELATGAIREAMEHAMELKVPLKVDMGWGKNWLEAH
ncbi:MAG: DNA polymerase I [Planctomycetota bacterium]|nr:MAG: DNA polymerase I [Planctomycetota bacterium]